MSECSNVDFAFLDSGTGGIPYLLRLKELMPEAKCVYVGDTANFPYGEKTHEEIVRCVTNIVKKIILSFHPKVIVIACNTMSVNALSALRSIFPDTLFVGTVPAIKLAASFSKTRKLGLLATSSTCQSPYNQELMEKFASDCELITRADPKLISFIEHESFTADSIVLEAAVLPAVDFFRVQGCDAIILGCTHFLNLADVFQNVAGTRIKIVDSRDGVCKHAVEVWKESVQKQENKGVAEMCSAEGVAENTEGGCSQGKAADCCDLAQSGRFPSYTPSKLYISGFYDKKDEKEYDVICNRYNLSFGGII